MGKFVLIFTYQFQRNCPICKYRWVVQNNRSFILYAIDIHTPLTYIDKQLLTFIETPVFTAQITSLLDDDKYLEFQKMLIANPEAGRVVSGTGGLRKIRWKHPGRQKGKRGGIRVIYFYRMHVSQVLLLTAYNKDHQSNLSNSQKRFFREIVRKWRVN